MNLQGEQLPSRVYTIADGLASDRVGCIFQDSRGFIWFCTSEGLSRFDGYQFRTFGIDQGLPGGVNDLLESPSGEYWVAGRNGVYRFNPAPSKGSPYFTLYRTGNDKANTLTTDGAGGIWFGTDTGLYHLERARIPGHSSSADSWSLHRVDVGLPQALESSEVVEALLRERDGGAMWIASMSGLFRRFSDGRSERYTARDGLYQDHVTSLLQDRQGGLWVGTWNGLCRVLTKRNSIKIEKVGLEGRQIYSLLESSGGRLWIGTSAGLYELLARNGRPEFRSYATAHSPTAKPVDALMEDRLGNVWLAGDDRAIFPQEIIRALSK